MITAQEALQQSLTGDPQRMLLIAEAQIKKAIANKESSCFIEYSKYLYSDLDIGNLRNNLGNLGYYCMYNIFHDGSNHRLEVRW